MKGSAKIELRDAKSGRLVKQIEKHNIVTNGAFNVMKLRQAFGLPMITLDGAYTILETYFGGILLFGTSIEEDVNNIIPSAEVRASHIGHASSYLTVTGDDLTGTYVAKESSIGTHKAKLVFSFDTTQANGNINCICLTSAVGGALGYGATVNTSIREKAESFVIFDDYYAGNTYDSRFKYESEQFPVVFKDDKSYNYYNDTVYVSDFSVVKNLGLNLSTMGRAYDEPYYGCSTAEETTDVSTDVEAWGYTNSINWSLNADRAVLWAERKEHPTTSRNIVEFEVIQAGETTSSKITLDYTNMVEDFCQKSGAYYSPETEFFDPYDTEWGLFEDYALTIQENDSKYYLCIYNISEGTYAVKLIEDTALLNVRSIRGFTNILGTIYLNVYVGSAGVNGFFRINLDTAEVADIPEFYAYMNGSCVHTTLDPDMPPIINLGVYSGYLTPYLATINNVDTLEKNASRTLKITYNLEY